MGPHPRTTGCQGVGGGLYYPRGVLKKRSSVPRGEYRNKYDGMSSGHVGKNIHFRLRDTPSIGHGVYPSENCKRRQESSFRGPFLGRGVPPLFGRSSLRKFFFVQKVAQNFFRPPSAAENPILSTSTSIFWRKKILPGTLLDPPPRGGGGGGGSPHPGGVQKLRSRVPRGQVPN